MYWTKDVSKERLQSAMTDIYMLAVRKRTVVHNYPDDGEPVQIGPTSDDTDWDKIMRTCENLGLKQSLIRTMANPGQSGDGGRDDEGRN